MSTTALFWTTSPTMIGRPSSPLNPHTHPPSSSSPMTSPTPSTSQATIRPFHLSQASGSRSLSYTTPPHASRATRYTRPNAKRVQTTPGSSPSDFFAEGTTPVEGAMWKERFERRIVDRERRKKARTEDLNRRRSVENSDMDAEEEQRLAKEDDEEIFRRLVIHQRRKATRAQMAELDDVVESDIWEAEFWDEPQAGPSTPHQPFGQAAHQLYDDGDQIMRSSPGLPSLQTPYRRVLAPLESEEERWAREAAEAEEAEREAEEAEATRRVEEAYWEQEVASDGMDLD